jgi:mutator protein MutT
VTEPGSRSASGFTYLGERVIHEGVVVRLVEGAFLDPDGQRMQRDIVRHPGAVGVIALRDDEVVLVRQYRGAVHREMLEIPAGKLDVDGEAPERAAVRELEEEVGLRARSLEMLCQLHCSVGFCDELLTVYLTTDFETVAPSQVGNEERYMTVEWMPLDAVSAALSDGTITDAKTLVGLHALLRRLGR